MNKNTLTFTGCNSSYEESKIIIFGAPFDGTTSFKPGTRFAPNAARIESYGLETYSPYLDLDLKQFDIADIGDINTQVGSTENALDEIYNMAKIIVDNNKIPFMIGGEHLVTLPTFKAIYEKYKDIIVLHFDAHTDLRDSFLGNKLSHATVLKRIWEIIGDHKIYQYGIRSGEKSEFDWAKDHIFLNKFNCDQIFIDENNFHGKKVYITIDLDVLDPSIFSGTGTPEPGGIDFNKMLDIINIFKNLDIVGIDVVELSPHYDTSGVSTMVACKIIRELLLAIMF